MEAQATTTYMGAFPLQHHRLDNGLEVLLLHNPVSPVAAYLTHYLVGSASETEQQRGLAHFFEHMMFRETERLGDGDFDRIMAQIGGVGLNAFTSYDTTAYHVNLPVEHLERVIDLEADRMVNLRLSPELIEAERGAVLGELRMYEDMPSEQLHHSLMAEAFPAHPYRHPIIGYAAQVEGFAQQDFERFYKDHYAPNRAVVVVAGGFDPERVLALIEQAYGGLAQGVERPRPPAADPPWAESRRVELRHPKVSTETLMLAWRTPGLEHPDLPALTVLAGILAQGQSAPLYRELVLTGIANSVGAYGLDLEMLLISPGLFMVDASLRHGVETEQAEASIHGLLRRMTGNGSHGGGSHGTGEGLAPEELERALNQYRLHAYSALSTNMSMARQVGGAFAAGRNPQFHEHLLRAVEAVTVPQVVDVLTRYLVNAPCLTVVQRPGTEGGQ